MRRCDPPALFFDGTPPRVMSTMLWREWTRLDGDLEALSEHVTDMTRRHPHQHDAILALLGQFRVVRHINTNQDEEYEAMADYQIDAFDRIIASKMSGMTDEQVKKYAATLRKMYPTRKDQIDKLSIEARRTNQ